MRTSCAEQPLLLLRSHRRPSQVGTGVNPAGDAGDTISPAILLRTFGYSRPILVAVRSLSLKPISFGYKTPPIRFSQAGGQSAHKARPPNLELALTPLQVGSISRARAHTSRSGAKSSRLRDRAATSPSVDCAGGRPLWTKQWLGWAHATRLASPTHTHTHTHTVVRRAAARSQH